MSDLNDISSTKKQIMDQTQKKEQFIQLETKIYKYVVTGGITLIFMIIINVLLICYIRLVVFKIPKKNPTSIENEDPQILLEEPTAPSREAEKNIGEEENEATSSFYPKLKSTPYI